MESLEDGKALKELIRPAVALNRLAPATARPLCPLCLQWALWAELWKCYGQYRSGALRGEKQS